MKTRTNFAEATINRFNEVCSQIVDLLCSKNARPTDPRVLKLNDERHQLMDILRRFDLRVW